LPTIKDLASHVTCGGAREILDHALRLKTTRQVIRYLGHEIERLAPNLKLLDLP
jgi:hypothetical protein